MKTEDLANKMMDKLNGALTEREAAEFDQYLANDADAKEDLDFFHETWSQLDCIETPEPTANLAHNFYEALDKELTAEQYNVKAKWQIIKGKFLRPMVISRAAVILVLLSAGLYFGSRFNLNPFQANAAVTNDNLQYASIYAPEQVEQLPAAERLNEMYSIAASDDEKRIIEELITSLQTDPNINVRLMAVQELTPYINSAKVRQKLTKQVKKEKSPLVQAELLNAIMAKADVGESISTMENLLRDKNLNFFVKEKIQKDLPILKASFTN